MRDIPNPFDDNTPLHTSPKLSQSRHTIMQPWKSYCDQAREKALSVVDKIKVNDFTEIMRAASHYEPEKVKAMLKENRHLIYAQGDFDQAFEKTEDGKDKTYKSVTLLQYLWIIGDIKLFEAVINGDQEAAAIQVLALSERQDIKLFTYDDTIEKYKNYMNYMDTFPKRNEQTLLDYWKEVGRVQFTWPAYLVAQMIETNEDNKTAWTKNTAPSSCFLEVPHKSALSDWAKEIKLGKAWLRGTDGKPTVVSKQTLKTKTWNDWGSYIYSKWAASHDLNNFRSRGEEQKKDRNRLSSELTTQLSQKSKAIASDLDEQHPTC